MFENLCYPLNSANRLFTIENIMGIISVSANIMLPEKKVFASGRMRGELDELATNKST